MSHSPKKLPDAALELIAGRFKALSEAVRLKLIMVLQTGEKNVSELVRATGKGQTSVSRHLQQLVDAGVLARRREEPVFSTGLSTPQHSIFATTSAAAWNVSSRKRAKSRLCLRSSEAGLRPWGRPPVCGCQGLRPGRNSICSQHV